MPYMAARVIDAMAAREDLMARALRAIRDHARAAALFVDAREARESFTAITDLAEEALRGARGKR